jgi:hypothetical protein
LVLPLCRFIIQITGLLEDSVKKKISKEIFIQKLNATIKVEDKNEEQRVAEILGKTFLKLTELEQKGINGIWSRIIRNAFAPLFVGKFDFVVGNPPWVNWEDLPQSYRDQTK